MPQKNLVIRYSPDINSEGGLLADYLQKSSKNTKDKVLDTVKMCWISAALLKNKDPNATEEYINTLKALAGHIRLLTNLHEFDKQEAWQILKAELSDFAETETVHEKLDRLLELCENGTPVKVEENNDSDSDDNLNREQKESTAKDFLMSNSY